MNFEAHFCHSFHLNFETQINTKLINETRTVCSTLNYNNKLMEILLISRYLLVCA